MICPTHRGPQKSLWITTRPTGAAAPMGRRVATASNDSRVPPPTPHDKSYNANDKRRTIPATNRTKPTRAKRTAAQMEAAKASTRDPRRPSKRFHPCGCLTRKMKRSSGVKPHIMAPLSPKEKGAPTCQSRRPGLTSRQHSSGHSNLLGAHQVAPALRWARKETGLPPCSSELELIHSEGEARAETSGNAPRQTATKGSIETPATTLTNPLHGMPRNAS